MCMTHLEAHVLCFLLSDDLQVQCYLGSNHLIFGEGAMYFLFLGNVEKNNLTNQGREKKVYF